MAMMIGIVHVPALHPVFGTTALTSAQWMTALAVAGLTAGVDWGLGEILDGGSREYRKNVGCFPG